MKISYVDSEKIGVFENGKTTVYESGYIVKYKANALQSAKNREWKSRTDMMIADEYYFQTQDETEIRVQITAVTPTEEENKIAYAYIVNGTSGVYYKYLDDKEKTEAHIISSGEVEFRSVAYYDNGEMLVTVQTDTVASRVAILKKDGDLKYYTGGDSLDENPSFDNQNRIVFNSYAVARDTNNNFIQYMPSEIYRLDPVSLDMQTLLSDEKFSFVKPMIDDNGCLYCIRKTEAEKTEESVFLQILMIPVRIIQAFVGLISAFVACFAKKPLVSGTSARSIGNGGDAAKNGVDPKKVWINNNLIDVDKELKRNKKSDDYGFIPKSWKLIKISPETDGSFDKTKACELASGVADYTLFSEDKQTVLVYTNGKRVFKTSQDGVKKKLFETDFCLKVSSLQNQQTDIEF